MRNATIGSIIVLVLIGVALALPSVFLPKRWLEIAPGQDRNVVHAVLGVPDADFTDAKGFDGWHNPFGVGASVLVVRYDYASKKVVSAKITTEWGTEHLKWVSAYKSQLSGASK